MDDPLPLPVRLRSRPAEGDDWVCTFDPLSQTAPGAPSFTGLHVFPEFLSVSESRDLLRAIEEREFVPAQSGKSKQHHGAKVNFNKRRIKSSAFRGLPTYAACLEARLKQVFGRLSADDALRSDEGIRATENFVTTDVFVLRYEKEEASNLDFHIDDTFAYGEAIFDISLESDSVLTFIRRENASEEPVECVRANLPARSVAFLFGAARYEWEHAILPYDILARRTSVTLRTLSPEAIRMEEGRRVLEIARPGSSLQPTG